MSRPRSLSPLNTDTFSNGKHYKIMNTYNSSSYVLPPISRQQRAEFESIPSTVITKFIETLSTELKNETDEIIINKPEIKVEESKNKKEEKKIKEENKKKNDERINNRRSRRNRNNEVIF